MRWNIVNLSHSTIYLGYTIDYKSILEFLNEGIFVSWIASRSHRPRHEYWIEARSQSDPKNVPSIDPRNDLRNDLKNVP